MPAERNIPLPLIRVWKIAGLAVRANAATPRSDGNYGTSLGHEETAENHKALEAS